MKKQIIAGVMAMALLGSFTLASAQQEAPKVNQTYRATPTKINDLVHTKLDVSFDYAKRHLNGKAWLTLVPHFYATDSLTLDAKGMDVKSVALVGAKANTPLKYTYDNEQLFVQLNKKYTRNEKYTIYIAYTAKPDELKVKGSAAITDAKGLYFINPDGTDKNKPTEIWTQGETEASSAWFPTIDKPNQKTTAEIAMTVEGKYTTLSNGKLISQKANANGTRTDVWKMDQPHSPYLFMMAVGPFKITKDTWKGKEVSYYLEPKYAPYAKQIFGKTPEMMTFYSNILGVDYPWVKYAQVVARDYVSGAMENTSATLHGEHVQKTPRELIDANEEGTIAHELFHQWFGDYVTAESWSNLTMNESFATFGEVLWHGHDEGKDAEDESRYGKLTSYLGSTKNGESPVLARHYYNDKEDMFDNISYSKGSIILYALKNQLGDDAFFKGLNLYLRTNAYKNGEPHQLRLALEEVSGRDLLPYFNQWYYAGGHPILDVKYDYKDGNAVIEVKQTQAADVQTFILPLKIDIYAGGQKISKEITINSREQSFSFPVSAKPELIDLDVDKILVGQIKDNKTLENYIFQYSNAPSYANRLKAIEQATFNNKEKAAQQLLLKALDDKNATLRAMALKGFNLKEEQIKAMAGEKIAALAKNDKNSNVRSVAIARLAMSGDKAYVPIFQNGLKEQSYKVIGTSLQAMNMVEPSSLGPIVAGLDQDTKDHLPSQLAQIYAALGDDSFHPFYLNIANTGSINALASVVMAYSNYLVKNKNPKITQEGAQAIVNGMNRTKLAQYYGKQFVQVFTTAEQTKMKEAESAIGDAKDNLLKQAAYFKAAAAELNK